MCGIVGAVAQRQVSGILIEGLRRLEYRGYDSAGMALLNAQGTIGCTRRVGKVAALSDSLASHPLEGTIGISHTRWATHGKPTEANAHPHSSGGRVALVHNGIIENHVELREELRAAGYVFSSETDTEVIVHLIDQLRQQGASLLDAVKLAIPRLDGAYAIAVIASDEPHRLVAARKGSPLVVGIGIGEHFVASDQMAIRQVTDRVIFLEEGDVVELTTLGVRICDAMGRDVQRAIEQLGEHADFADKGRFRHYMLKEIHEQPSLVDKLAAYYIKGDGRKILESLNGFKPKGWHLTACGTAWHAGLVIKNFLEANNRQHASIDIASEFRYRSVVLRPDEDVVMVTY